MKIEPELNKLERLMGITESDTVEIVFSILGLVAFIYVIVGAGVSYKFRRH